MSCKKTMVLWILLLLALVAILINVREGFNPATERPSSTDQSLRKSIEAFAGTTDYAIVENYIMSIQSFYDKVYLPKKESPTTEQVKAFVDKETLQAGMTKDVLTRAIDYVFLSTESKPEETPKTEATTPAGTTTPGGTITPAGTTGGSSNILGATTPTPSTKGKNIFGPTFAGFGAGDAKNSTDTSKTLEYPQLLGGGIFKPSTRIDGVGIVAPSLNSGTEGLPSSKSLGTDENAKFFPNSRSPGDMDLIPDPYRVSSTFTTSSYSSKTEPVPFLTDFSAFLK